MAYNPLPESTYSSALKNNTCRESFSFGPYTIQLERIENMERLLEAISEEEFNKDERLPYWAEIWPSALALSEYLVENEPELKNKQILEIGCGLGLVGITATYCGANVLFTDYEPLALTFTERNFKRNFKRPAPVECMDWRDPPEGREFDLIVAADVLYEKRWLEPVINVVRKCLVNKGEFIIAEPNRSIAKDFFTRIDELGWEHHSQLKKVPDGNKLKSVSVHRICIC